MVLSCSPGQGAANPDEKMACHNLPLRSNSRSNVPVPHNDLCFLANRVLNGPIVFSRSRSSQSRRENGMSSLTFEVKFKVKCSGTSQ